MILHSCRATGSAILLAAGLGTSARALCLSVEFDDVVERYERWRAVEFHEWSASLDAFDLHGRTLEDLFCDLDAIDSTGRDRTNYEVLRALVENRLSYWRFEHFLPITEHRGIHVWLSELGTNRSQWTIDELERYACELEAVPSIIDTTIELMDRGLARNWTPPRLTVSQLPIRLRREMGDLMEQLGRPFGAVSDPSAEQQVRELWRSFYLNTRPEINAGVERLASYLEITYLPQCRTSIAVGDLREGAAYYEFQLRTLAETDLTPREIHDLGLSEVKRIQGRILELIPLTGFAEECPDADTEPDDRLLAAFNEYMRTAQRFRFDGPDEVVSEYCRVAKTVDGWLPQLFATLPELTCWIGAAPPHIWIADPVEFRVGDMPAGIASALFINVSSPQLHRTFEVKPLLLHEVVPGHHLQISLARELQVPAFRRDAFFAAFGEGWALYAEGLGAEMNLFLDPHDLFGLLNSEMYRACRLVVDTGIHALGWSRERAAQLMLDKTSLSHERIQTEIDRYVVNPGQACSYKIGELRIRALRIEAECKLGSKFDLREFHGVLLGGGALPLDVVERRVRLWIDAAAAEGDD